MQKLLAFSMALALITSVSQAQLLNKILPTSPFAESLAVVVENYQNNYQKIQGAALPADEDRDIFQSAIHLPGTSKCVIYRFHSVEDTTASWQAIIFSGEDFKEASKVYKNTFKYLKQTKFKVGEIKNSFEGDMISPTDELRFTTTILRPAVYSEMYKNFIAEIEMINTIEGWTVQLNLHSRKDDSEQYQ